MLVKGSRFMKMEQRRWPRTAEQQQPDQPTGGAHATANAWCQPVPDRMLLMPSQWLQGLSPEFGFAGVPVPHLPRRDGGDDGAAHRAGAGPKVIRKLTHGAQDRPAHSGLRHAVAPVQSGTPTMGGC